MKRNEYITVGPITIKSREDYNKEYGERELPHRPNAGKVDMSYIGICPQCNGIQLVVCDNPQYSAVIAKDVAEAIKRGLTVERVPDSDAKKRQICRCANDGRKKRPAANKPQK